MKVKELINNLQKFVDKYGEDLQVVLSADEEGNEYSTIDDKSLSLVLDNPGRSYNRPVGICIYPWEGHCESAEEACAIGRECGNHPYCNNGEGCDTCKINEYRKWK